MVETFEEVLEEKDIGFMLTDEVLLEDSDCCLIEKVGPYSIAHYVLDGEVKLLVLKDNLLMAYTSVPKQEVKKTVSQMKKIAKYVK